MSAFSWISEFVQWIAAWIPRLAIVRPNFKVIKFVRGKHVRILEPGIWVYWPIVTEVWWVSTGIQVVSTTNQVIDTIEGNTVVCSAQLTFRVINPVKYAIDLVEPEEAIIEVALSTIRKVVITKTYKTLLTDHESVATELTKAVSDQLSSYGVKVLSVRICDLAKTRVYCILNNQSDDKALAVGKQ